MSIHHFFFRVIFLCLMETQKFFDDESFTNKAYAKIGNIDVYELLNLEIELLKSVQFDLSISYDDYIIYTNKLTQFWDMNMN